MNRLVLGIALLAQAVVAGAAGWVPAGPADGSYVVATHPTVPGFAILASTYAQGGTYSTVDGGSTFTRAPGLVEAPVWFAGTAGALWRAGPTKSTDLGRTWTYLDSGYGPLEVLGVNPSNSNELVARGYDKVLHSVDGARTWTFEYVSGNLDRLTVDWTTRRVYGIRNGAFGRRALDEPGTWAYGPVAQWIAAANGVVLLGDREGALSRSTDGGATFGPVGGNVGPISDAALAFARAPSQRVYASDATTGKVLRSDDLGATWSVATILHDGTYPVGAALAVDAGNAARVYASTGRGILASVDGATSFQPLARSTRVPGGFRTLAFDATDPARQWAGSLDYPALLASNDGGASWSRIGDFQSVSVVGASRMRTNTLYASNSQSSTFGVSSDGGLTWRSTIAGAGENSYFAAYASGPSPGQMFVADRIWTGTGYLYRVHESADDGESFTPRAAPPLAIESLAASPTDPKRLYAGGFEDVYGGKSQMWMSTDGALSWQHVATFPDRPPTRNFGGGCCSGVYAIAVDAATPSHVSAGLAQPPYVMRSDDGGATWARANAGLGIGEVRSIVIDPVNPSTLYVSQWGSGVYRSVDRSATWQALDEGLTDDRVWQVALDPLDPARIYAATAEGLFRADLASGVPTGHRRAIEFHHAAFDHYFVSADVDEIAALDDGAFFGWQRTSDGFRVATVNDAGTVPTCRFFGVGFAPLSSHFYTPYPAECEGLKTNPAWLYERVAFALAMPDPVTRGCPPGTRGLYRAWNQNRQGAPNHRFTADLDATFYWTLWQGWQHEGNADTLVFACVPQ
jgi:photosystem II stability/assembly factor-like uncharacterized protein